MVDRYSESEISAFLYGYKKQQRDAIRANLKADAAIVAGLAGWHAYRQHAAAARQHKKKSGRQAS